MQSCMGYERGNAGAGPEPTKLRLRTICCSCGAQVDPAQIRNAEVVRRFHTKRGNRLLIETDTACRECGANRVKRLVQQSG